MTAFSIFASCGRALFFRSGRLHTAPDYTAQYAAYFRLIQYFMKEIALINPFIFNNL